jgi:hypothetical protein
MELTIGKGCVAVAGTEKDGVIGIVFEQMDEIADIGSVPVRSRKKPREPFIPTEQDFILWIENLESALVVKHIVDLACKTLAERRGIRYGQ